MCSHIPAGDKSMAESRDSELVSKLSSALDHSAQLDRARSTATQSLLSALMVDRDRIRDLRETLRLLELSRDRRAPPSPTPPSPGSLGGDAKSSPQPHPPCSVGPVCVVTCSGRGSGRNGTRTRAGA